MTPLAVEIQRILESESAYPPLSATSLVRVLKATGYPNGPADLAAVEAALFELSAAGRARRTFSPRLGERWRAVQAARPVAADETDRPLPTPSPTGDR